MSDGSNFQQRVWDAFPPYPQYITIFALREAFQWLEVETVRKIVQTLVRKGVLERHAVMHKTVLYRRRKKAKRPIDMRGRHGNSGRKPKNANKPVPVGQVGREAA